MANGSSREGEPSVEEILGSIKRIIAENEALVPASGRRRSAKRTRAESRSEFDDIDVDRDDILDLDDAMLADSDSVDEGADALDAILANETAKSVRHSLAALTAISEPGARPQIVRSGETSIESLVREMLKPMLKDWLDSNLPDLVEEAVAREIRRISAPKKR